MKTSSRRAGGTSAIGSGNGPSPGRALMGETRRQRPGGNVTGFMQFDYSLCGKWLELLKQIAPETKRVGVLRDPAVTEDIGQFAVVQSVASSVGVEVVPVSLGDTGNMEASIAAFSRSPNGGMIVTAGALAVVNRDLLIGR